MPSGSTQASLPGVSALGPFSYRPSPVRARFGAGAIERAGEEADALGVGRIVVLVSASTTAAGERLKALLGGVCAGLSASARPDTPQEAVDEALQAALRARADGFIVVGGGSAIGLGKTLAAVTGLPWIALPTTYSGAEMMPNWYVGSGPRRYGGTDARALPRAAIYDPELTLTLPPGLSAASGMNAMAHAVESLYGPDVNPVVTAMATQAVARLGHALPRIVDDPGHLGARADALYGAWVAAAFRAKSGIEHALAQRVRQWFGLDHARTHAVMLPYAVAFNAGAASEAMHRIERALGAEEAGRALYDLNVRLGLATSLKDLGLARQDIARAVEIVAEQRIAHPRPVSRADIQAILEQAYDGAPPQFHTAAASPGG